mmetsp:Transcript_15618/g.21362  ORF Transcript_15618/g.21362 Transcript_15618/m.21362 type:complete len:88 (-) Transcript_15618:305-568(-)|eukprot:CAMPEP_0185731200 /NCGR_PEP_ID=MMETSP1171-20130828/12191_1 /TAXON_ID=374046 /ORGANISM="Helicotheca tamensis, Strain CCMP826" /LENGTH=87 /DNA_ID=CAMNT_0028400413 /DNA_START=120 /DNA_END=383 /DNA_ORIENTATION=-
MSSHKTSPTTTASDEIIHEKVYEGLTDVAIRGSIGFGVGMLASIVLARGGGGSGARKAITAFGGGVGLGSGWTKCSIEIEELLKGQF